MINPRISAVWSTTKKIAPFSCTRHVQEVYTKDEVVYLTPCLLGLGVLFNCHTYEMCCETYDYSNKISSFEYDQTDFTILLYTTCTRSTYQT